MKYIENDEATELPCVELTERNLRTLLAKLEDPDSKRTIIDGQGRIAVRAVTDDEHYKTRAPGITLTNGVYK